MTPRIVALVVLALSMPACAGSGSIASERYDCGQNTAGTGDLAVDIVGRWAFVQNASQQYFTFDDSGMAIRTWTSDEDNEVTTTEFAYTVRGNLVEIEEYGVGTIEFVAGEGNLWTASDPAADTDWIRCRRIEE